MIYELFEITYWYLMFLILCWLLAYLFADIRMKRKRRKFLKKLGQAGLAGAEAGEAVRGFASAYIKCVEEMQKGFVRKVTMIDREEERKYKPNIICSWCNEPIRADEAKIFDEHGNEWLHLGCSIEKDDKPENYGYEGDG